MKQEADFPAHNLTLSEAVQQRSHLAYSSIFKLASLRNLAAVPPDIFSARASMPRSRTLSLICSRTRTPEAVMPERQRLSANKKGARNCQSAVKGLPVQPAWVLQKWWSQSNRLNGSPHLTLAPVRANTPHTVLLKPSRTADTRERGRQIPD